MSQIQHTSLLLLLWKSPFTIWADYADLSLSLWATEDSRESLGQQGDQTGPSKRKLTLRQWRPTPVLLPGKSHRWRSLVAFSPWGREESDTAEWLHLHFSLSCIGEGNGNPLQCSRLENLRDGGAWWAAVYGVTQSRTRLKWLSSSSSIHWKDWWWSWSSNTLATWCKRANSLEKTLMLGKIEGRRKRGRQRRDGWMASSTQWTWVEQTPGESEGQGSLVCCNP